MKKTPTLALNSQKDYTIANIFKMDYHIIQTHILSCAPKG